MAPSATIDMDTSVIPDSQNTTEKKHKRDKSERKKKRARDDDEAAVVEETPRKPKKSKSEIPDSDGVALKFEAVEVAAGESKPKKKKRRDHEQAEQPAEQDEQAPAPAADQKRRKMSKKGKAVAEEQAPEEETQQDAVVGADSASRKKSKKEKKQQADEKGQAGTTQAETAGDLAVKEPGDKKKKDKKSKKRKSEVEVAQDLMEVETAEPPAPGKKKRKKVKSKDKKRVVSPQHFDAMDVDAPSTPTKTQSQNFPFFTQSVSLYVPFFPVGFDKPLTNVAAQHLDPLLNHYSPTLRGVLLSYSNLNLSDRPVKASVINPPTDDTPALLHSIDEYAVGFGWLTFDAHLFVPARGQWMEGVLQIQNEGHIGVVCWNKFNASVEARRLPKGWKWVDVTKEASKPNKTGLPSPDSDEDTSTRRSDELDGENAQAVEQMHSTGYWVDERGKKIGGKLRFRIKNFDVGLAGDYGYLSIEGTFLNDEDERALVAEEREREKRRRKGQNASGLLRPMSRRVPEFSMTKLGREDQEEDSAQRAELYKGSRPGTPDD